MGYRSVVTFAVVMGILSTSSAVPAVEGAARTGHTTLTPEALQWGPFPAGGPNTQLAVLSGDPGKPGPFVIRVKTPDGFHIPPHWHPADEHITVISGTFALGMGEKFDEAALHDMPAGSYGMLPKKMRHFALTRGETVVQIHGMGPFKVIYVNPADDPLRKKP